MQYLARTVFLIDKLNIFAKCPFNVNYMQYK